MTLPGPIIPSATATALASPSRWENPAALNTAKPEEKLGSQAAGGFLPALLRRLYGLRKSCKQEKLQQPLGDARAFQDKLLKLEDELKAYGAAREERAAGRSKQQEPQGLQLVSVPIEAEPAAGEAEGTDEGRLDRQRAPDAPAVVQTTETMRAVVSADFSEAARLEAAAAQDPGGCSSRGTAWSDTRGPGRLSAGGAF